MIFKVTLDDYTGLYRGINGAVAKEVAKLNLSPEAKSLEAVARVEKIEALCGKWFEDGETLTVEIDTVAQTCTVVRQ
jgi:hypothetical protein